MVREFVGLGCNRERHEAIEPHSDNLYAFKMFSSANVWMSNSRPGNDMYAKLRSIW